MWVVAMMVSSGFGLGFAGSTSNLIFCIIMVKNMKMLLLARDSPRHILFPIPNGVNYNQMVLFTFYQWRKLRF